MGVYNSLRRRSDAKRSGCLFNGKCNMRMVLISMSTSLAILVLSGCGPRHNNCYEQCCAIMNAMPGPLEEHVKCYEIDSDPEQLRQDSFSDCINVGKSHFSGPPMDREAVKRFAARIGANVILWHATLERAGFNHDCQCRPIGSHEVVIEEDTDDNQVVFVSKSMSVGGSAAAGPGATYIYSHQIWFLYEDEQ